MSITGYGFYGVSEEGWRRAVLLWNTGLDTKDIATALTCEEAVVYNLLPIYRTFIRASEVKAS